MNHDLELSEVFINEYKECNTPDSMQAEKVWNKIENELAKEAGGEEAPREGYNAVVDLNEARQQNLVGASNAGDNHNKKAKIRKFFHGRLGMAVAGCFYIGIGLFAFSLTRESNSKRMEVAQTNRAEYIADYETMYESTEDGLSAGIMQDEAPAEAVLDEVETGVTTEVTLDESWIADAAEENDSASFFAESEAYENQVTTNDYEDLYATSQDTREQSNGTISEKAVLTAELISALPTGIDYVLLVQIAEDVSFDCKETGASYIYEAGDPVLVDGDTTLVESYSLKEGETYQFVIKPSEVQVLEDTGTACFRLIAIIEP